MLVGGIVGVNDHDGLPPALAALGIGGLEGGRGDEDGERQALGVHTGLDDLLAGAEVLVAVDDGHGGAHGGDPGRKHNAVAVLAAPVHEALGGRLRGQTLLLLLPPARLDVVVHGVLGPLEVDAVALRQDDGAEGARRGDQEGAEGEGELADQLVPLHAEHDTTETEDETGASTDQTALDDLGVVGLLLFLADDLHCCCLCRVTLGAGSGGGCIAVVFVVAGSRGRRLKVRGLRNCECGGK